MTRMDYDINDQRPPEYMQDTSAERAMIADMQVPVTEVVIDPYSDGSYVFDFKFISGERDERIRVVCENTEIIEQVAQLLRDSMRYILEIGVIKVKQDSIRLSHRTGDKGQLQACLTFDVHKDVWDAACKEKCIDFDWMDPSAIKES